MKSKQVISEIDYAMGFVQGRAAWRFSWIREENVYRLLFEDSAAVTEIPAMWNDIDDSRTKGSSAIVNWIIA